MGGKRKCNFLTHPFSLLTRYNDRVIPGILDLRLSNVCIVSYYSKVYHILLRVCKASKNSFDFSPEKLFIFCCMSTLEFFLELNKIKLGWFLRRKDLQSESVKKKSYRLTLNWFRCLYSCIKLFVFIVCLHIYQCIEIYFTKQTNI